MKKVLILAIFLLLVGASCGKEVGEEYNWSTMDEGPYKDKVSYATSADLLHWTDSEVILAEHASVPGVIYKDGVIYVYFTDVSTDGIVEQLGMIKSEDEGKNWSEKKIIDIQGIEDRVAIDPAPLVTEDGKIRLYYFDGEGAKTSSEHKIYSAISEDGENFIQEDGVRLTNDFVYDPDVQKVGDKYYMYIGDIQGNVVAYAESSNGLDFEFKGVVYEGGAVPDVYFDGQKYYLYISGIDILTSEDGLNFQKNGYLFRSNIGEVTSDASVIKLKDGTYMMLYKTKTDPIPRKMFEENN